VTEPDCSFSGNECSCTMPLSGNGGDGGACPPSKTTSLVCCANLGWPGPGVTCACNAIRVGCTYDVPSAFCACERDYSADSGTACSPPSSSWTACCNQVGGCICTAKPGGSCVGTPVTACSPDAGLCWITESGDCTCSEFATKGMPGCPPPPSLVCCLDKDAGSCGCSAGTTCEGGTTLVGSCTAALVTPYVKPTCADLQTRVASCSPVIDP
jgi:hypothetical protein